MTHPLYALIEPQSRTVMFNRYPDYKSACAAAGLGDFGLDFGTLAHFSDGSTLSIMVFEFGLIDGGKQFPDQYWAVGRQLFNGPAALFVADETGETVDIHKSLEQAGRDNKSHLESHITWIGAAQAAETLIQANLIDRPRLTVNGETIWEWKPGEAGRRQL